MTVDQPMRKTSGTPFVVLTAILSLAACGGASDATNPNGPVTQPSTVSSTITAGTWAVGTLTQNTEDKANQFSASHTMEAPPPNRWC
jgi:ABC-type glycerol-3-phosphate transport system substrate-binding protein